VGAGARWERPPLSCLSVERLSRAFGGLTAVHDVSFAVEDRSITGLIGPNGSGKTVTFDCITGFYRPDGGRVVLRDDDITGLRPEQIAVRGVARSFQLTGVFRKLTVEQNLVFAAQDKRLAASLGALLAREGGRAPGRDVASALDFIGLASVRHERVERLPYGQQKLLELGGLLVMEPTPILYLLDEPFAGLTQDEIQRYLALMRDMRARATFLIVEHNMRAVMTVCDRVIVLDHGEKIAEGTPMEIQANPRVVEAYLGHARAAARP
jgi:branched-chain amino acid transport system ATP-binding protein